MVGLVVAGISSDIKQMHDHGRITRIGFVHGELREVGPQDVIKSATFNISNLQVSRGLQIGDLRFAVPLINSSRCRRRHWIACRTPKNTASFI